MEAIARRALRRAQSLKGWSTEEGWFILTNLTDLTSAINAYKKRYTRLWREASYVIRSSALIKYGSVGVARRRHRYMPLLS